MKLTVFRYNPQVDEKPRYESYEVEHHPHMKIIDALQQINERYGANIAYRSSCRAGQCGSCAVLANRKPVLACRTDVEDGMLLEPLKNLPVIKDLAVALQSARPKVASLRPYLHRGGSVPGGVERIELSRLRALEKPKSCIECWCCMSTCPAHTHSKEFAGPALFRLISRFVHDPRDVLDRLGIAVSEGLYLCTTCGTCRAVCPQGIDVTEEIRQLRHRVYRRELIP